MPSALQVPVTACTYNSTLTHMHLFLEPFSGKLELTCGLDFFLSLFVPEWRVHLLGSNPNLYHVSLNIMQVNHLHRFIGPNVIWKLIAVKWLYDCVLIMCKFLIWQCFSTVVQYCRSCLCLWPFSSCVCICVTVHCNM